MAPLAVVAADNDNGVAELHSRLIRSNRMPDSASFWPRKFTNVTNAVMPRRWMALANPALDSLLQEVIGSNWSVQPDLWQQLEACAADASVQERWASSRLEAKQQLARQIADQLALAVEPASLFDVQVKRIHEYKRQHLNALQLICRYLRIKQSATADLAPRIVIYGGKSVPGSAMDKLIIGFIHGFAEVVDCDPDCKGLFKVVSLPDCNGKLSENVDPATDLSEQMSTADSEASGDGT